MGAASRMDRYWGRAVIVVAAWLAVAGTALADETPPPIQRAVNVVAANGKSVLDFAYPTVTFKAVGPCAWSAAAAGFVLTCPFSYVDGHDTSTRRLTFWLDRNGIFSSVRDGGGPDIWPPFLTATVAKDVLAQMAKDELAKNRASNDENNKRLLRLLAQSPTPEQIVVFLLNVGLFIP